MTSPHTPSESPALTRRTLFIAGAGVAALTPVAAEAARSEQPLLGPARGVAWLRFNENPYGPSERTIRAMSAAGVKGAYYADEAQARLEAMIAERHRVRPEQVVVTCGSGEVLNAIALAWSRKGPIVAPNLFFDAPAEYGVRTGGRLIRAPMATDLGMDLDAIRARTADAGLVLICNPNNPTGILHDPAALRTFCRAVAPKTTVAIDEAYNEITDHPERNSMIDLVREGANVIVTRTFSKIYGMAGIRVGYAIASPENAEIIRGHAMTSLGGPALAGAIAAYDDLRFLAYSRSKIVEAREMVQGAARAAGLATLPSQTNFVLVDVKGSAETMRREMETRGVIIRGPYAGYPNWSRVSMGRIEDVARYCAALPRAAAASAAA